MVFAACGSASDTPAPTRRDAGVAHRPEPKDAAVPKGYTGVIAAAESVDVAPRFGGVVAKVTVRVGDVVSEGQVVAEMDQKSMQEELRAAQAALNAASAAARQAEVDVEDARRKLALETKAVADGVSPRAALDEAKLAVKRAEAAAQRAGAAAAAESSHVQTAKDHVSDLALRAPANGTVALRFKDPGATVAAGASIVRIVGKGGLRLRFAVPPDEAHGLATGGTVTATIDTLAQPVSATIQQVSPALDPASGMIIVEAALPAETDLRPGLAAAVKRAE